MQPTEFERTADRDHFGASQSLIGASESGLIAVKVFARFGNEAVKVLGPQ